MRCKEEEGLEGGGHEGKEERAKEEKTGEEGPEDKKAARRGETDGTKAERARARGSGRSSNATSIAGCSSCMCVLISVETVSIGKEFGTQSLVWRTGRERLTC